MKLFLHDAKHDQILAEYDLGGISMPEQRLVERLIGFLENHHVFDRYRMAVLADGWRRVQVKNVFDEPETEIEFY